ncbi:MAG TPA: glycosyltransferase family 2 protein, partial [Gemmatimonadales bacterium]|nr:glycosyltransferase family 2 protein [Gemmatimonadales bacterium]
MIYVCVPAHNEATTVGLVLWKVRQVFTAFEREYQILACDDASTDATADVLASYARVLPLTVIKHRSRQGYARSLEELLRLALQRTDRPKRDCAITLHADFVHGPETMEEMVKRLESGADLVVGEQSRVQGASTWQERWARQWAPRFLRVGGVKDSISGFLALRLIVLRQATKGGDAALLRTEGWSANAELLAHLSVHARRMEVVPSAARYDLKQRASRSKPWQQLMSAWKSRSVISAARKATPVILLALLAGITSLIAQNSSRTDSVPPPTSPPPVIRAAPAAPAVPFPVGEKFSFGARYGIFNIGSATMEVMGTDTVHGVETVHLRFRITGGALGYHLDQTMESWVGSYDFRSRRFSSVQDERGKH